jgi:diguanylate cyclase (GGDEF)-like protein
VAPPGELDEAVDTVAVVLRDLGRFAVDIGSEGAEAIAGEAERWAQHVLIFAPSPDGRGRTGDRRRNWPGVRRFLARHRRAEAERVAQSLRGLRSVVWAFVRSLRNAAGDPEADAQMRSHLDRLREAALAGEPRRLERQALEAADAIAGILERRAEELRRERARLGERLHHLGFELEEVRDQATRDPLTGVMNRRSLDAFLERTVDLCAALDQPALLLMVDVDHFKRVNDTFGHPAGDEVLRVVADTLVRTFLRKNDFVGRYGGEEFVVVLRDAGNASAEQVGQRLLDAVRRLRIPVPAPTLAAEATASAAGLPEAGAQTELEITVSVGAAAARSREGARDWLARADRALYEAKAAGRDRCVVAPA